jgi:hypothetical protein
MAAATAPVTAAIGVAGSSGTAVLGMTRSLAAPVTDAALIEDGGGCGLGAIASATAGIGLSGAGGNVGDGGGGACGFAETALAAGGV